MIRLLKWKAFVAAKPGDQHQPVVDWPQHLVLFFRAMALLQILKGLVHWGLLIGGDAEAGAMPMSEYLAANMYFAVLDPVAGVGLWMTSSWGSVLWLLAAASQIAVCIGFTEIYGLLLPVLALEIAAVSGYVFLTLKVAQVSDD